MSRDYKDTLNLPRTDFPMKANLAQREPQMLERWEQAGVYRLICEGTAEREPFVLHDGPPYANGAAHIGHALNKILKDIVVKSRLLAGYRSPYVPGWDCHGLPIELEVEKKVGKVGHKVDAETFRRKCREYATRQIDVQRGDFKRFGVLGDWEDPYRTMDFKYEADIIRALAKIVDNGHLNHGVKPVNWCFECGSALAEAEIEYQDKQSPAIDVAFAAVDPAALAAKFGADGEGLRVSVVIWTTTPWTLPANQAVALHPDLDYLLVRLAKDHAVVLVEELAGESMRRYGVDGQVEVLGRAAGRKLEGAPLEHPFYRRQVPLVVAEHVTTEAGTGCVHTAPGHGQEDFEIGTQYDLPVVNPVDARGYFLPDTELFAEEHVWQAGEHILSVLAEHGTLLANETYQHSYPHCWRHKTPTAFRVTPQWFIQMDKAGLRSAALAAIKTVKWIPSWGEQRIATMIENRPDWCISRQRTWGVPIVLFRDRETGAAHPDSARLMRVVADRVEREGTDAWQQLDPAELLGADAERFEKVTDILDVWFDSGVSHYCVLEQRPELGSPAGIYLEGSDQHRGWFQSSLLTSVAMYGRAPYREVLTHGFTVDADGFKMSKSRGNVIAPQQVMKTLGADILRLWVAATDYRYEMSVSDEILKRVADAYRRIRNTARYFLSNLHGFDPAANQVPVADCLALDRWAIDRAWRLQREVVTAYDEYQYTLIYQRVHHFCSIDMGAFYLDIIKDRLYTTQPDSLARRSAQTAMYHILEAMVRWLAPILSFTAEEIWERTPGEQSATVFLSQWYRGLEPMTDAAELALWDEIAQVREGVSRELEGLRKAGTIGSGLDARVRVFLPAERYRRLLPVENELRFVFITSEATLHPLEERGDGAAACRLGDDEIYVEVARSEHGKCARCWHRRPEIGLSAEHPELCGRCVVNVAGQGETRRFA